MFNWAKRFPLTKKNGFQNSTLLQFDFTTNMDVFKIARLSGILPFEVGQKGPVLCQKWLYHSYLLALVVIISTFYRGLFSVHFLDTSEDTITRSGTYMFLLTWEPMIYFVNCTLVYYSLKNTKIAERAIRVLKLLLELKMERAGRRVTYCTLACSTIFLVMGLVHSYY